MCVHTLSRYAIKSHPDFKLVWYTLLHRAELLQESAPEASAPWGFL